MDARFQSAFSAGKDTSSRDSCFLGKEKKERCKKSGIRSLATLPFEVGDRNYRQRRKAPSFRAWI